MKFSYLFNQTKTLSNYIIFKRQLQISFTHKYYRSQKNNSFSSQPDNEAKEIFERLVNKDRTALPISITLIESTNSKKQEQANQLMKMVLQRAKDDYHTRGRECLSFRIGLTGPPGAGKSSFIEVMGKYLTSMDYKIAVLVVDPSSTTTGGSILGDKTRMTYLSRDPNAYIRPSPTGGHLGGVTRTTNEVIALCECAGYDIIFVETVGVGQAEYVVSDMVDMVLLLLPPGGGDELQGLKRGIVEIADLVVVTKADGDLIPSAHKIQAEYVSALKFFRRRSKVWTPKVKSVSSKTKEGIKDLWIQIEDFWAETLNAGELETKRSKQQNKWLWTHIHEELTRIFHDHALVKKWIPKVEQQIKEGSISPGQASDILIKHFMNKDKQES